MKVLVTGREGQLVQSLVERAACWPDLTIVTAGRPELNLEKPDTIARCVAALSPDLVINAAAYTAVDQAEDDADRAFRINGAAAGELAAAAATVGATIVHISTDYVFDGTAEAPYTEDHAVSPLGVYGRSKLAGEEQVRASNPRHVIVRTSWVYSPFGKNFVRTMINAANHRDVLNVVGDQWGSPTSALDLADGLLTLAAKFGEGRGHGIGKTYHLAGFGATSWHGLAKAIFAQRAQGGAPPIAVNAISTAEWPTRAARPRFSVLDSSRFVSDFGFTMPHWQASLETVVARLTRRN
jgi:dTDP-4-dehydrorhamnose reductase